MGQAMPESVKWLEVHGLIAEAVAKEGFPYELKLARDELMILLGLDYWFYGAPAIGANAVNLALWRKTDKNPTGSIYTEGDSPDMIWSREWTTGFVTESLKASEAENIVFPWPIVLIRAPRLIVRTSVITNLTFSVRLYYLLREVNDADLARLMVKDHA